MKSLIRHLKFAICNLAFNINAFERNETNSCPGAV